MKLRQLDRGFSLIGLILRIAPSPLTGKRRQSVGEAGARRSVL
jgi:hypothetical protein